MRSRQKFYHRGDGVCLDISYTKIMPKYQPQEESFSIAEGLIIFVVLLVFFCVSIPVGKYYLVRIRQSEAKNNLIYFYHQQKRFYSQNGSYSQVDPVGYGTQCQESKAEIKLDVPNCQQLRYRYSVEKVGKYGFIATAMSGENEKNKVFSGCHSDVWQIDENKRIRPISDITDNCLSSFFW